jgi:hypothetical protein
LKRAEALPANMPRPLLKECLLAAAKAGAGSGQGRAARRYAARVLWQLDPSPGETRAARLAVIDGYIADREGDPAFLAMLRFQQDYAPLDRPTAERFVEALLGLGMEKRAVNWLASLDDASAVKLMLRLKAGLAGPEAIIAQARAALAKAREDGAGYWRVLAEAAQRRGDAAVRVEALEHVLDSREQPAAQSTGAATGLWDVYLAAARDVANREHMLSGDDGPWADYAARQLSKSPPVARAFFAHLVLRARTRETRFNAQLQLAYSLEQARLERAALRLFDAMQWGEAGLDPQTRYLLGSMAERSGQPALAIRFWKDLPAPTGVSPEQWQVRLAAAYWGSGMADEAFTALRELLSAGRPPTPDTVRAVRNIAREMLASGKPEPAEEILRRLLPVADSGQARDILYSLGSIAEKGGRFTLAADYFLRSALLADGKTPDALALQTRLAAGLSLAQAGYRADARAQFEWLLKHATDPAQLDIARRELSKL